MEKLTKTMNIADAMEEFPKLIDILREKEIGCVGCMMAHSESIEEGLKMHGFSDKEIDEIIDKVNNELKTTKKE